MAGGLHKFCEHFDVIILVGNSKDQEKLVSICYLQTHRPKKTSLELLLIGGPSVAMFFGNLKLISHATLKFLLLQLLLLIIYLLVRNILVVIPCRIRKGVPSEARVVARVLPPLLLDFFPVQEIMNKVIGEFLSSQQPHPELMAQIIFKVSEVLCCCSVEPIKVSLSQNSFSLLFTFKTGAFLHLRLF